MDVIAETGSPYVFSRTPARGGAGGSGEWTALGRVLSRETIPRLSCRAIAGAANDQLADPADAERLRERGILYAPDFVVNAGGAVAITGMEAMGWSPARAEREVRGIGETLSRVFERAEREGISTDAAARRLAAERLHETR